MVHKTTREWLASGAPWVWLTAGSVSLSLIMVFGLLTVITLRGMGHFWPSDVARLTLHRSTSTSMHALGEFVDTETVAAARLRSLGVAVSDEQQFVKRYLLKVGNRDVGGFDFKWFDETEISEVDYPPTALVAEREEWGNFYGFLIGIKEDGDTVSDVDDLWSELGARLQRARRLKRHIRDIEKQRIGAVSYRFERLRLETRKLDLGGLRDPQRQQQIELERAQLEQDYAELNQELATLYGEVERDAISAQTVAGDTVDLRVADLVRVFMPNQMGVRQKLVHYLDKLREFVLEDPREANTEGGVFPAIFGTVAMVLLMSVFVTPFGVVAAIYMREYARQGTLTRIIRIAVNNLAGVPSVVYGVFGLGFFVYLVGGSLDELFYPEALPAPILGTPGMLWSSLTLAILTVPVVIVATEEGLTRIPRSIREGSLALGATKAETLWRIVLPMATPAMMTGLILAVARAAGEVAPLMMVGVVKLAPSLPLDGNFPYFHLDRKFMHLGFHIYDVGFQSPNVEAARPLVYATSLLLVIIIVALNLAAIAMRNRLREKYNLTES